MVYSLSYRRPARISQATSTHWSFEEREKYVEESIRSGSTGNTFAGIPDALSFDRIVSGGTCPPCTLREFMDYLAHIELAAENLQFYLWYRDYCRRFAETPASEKALAPEWTDAHMAGENDHVPPPAKTQTKLSPETLDMLEKTKIEVSTLETGADGMLPPPSAGYGSESDGQTITGPWEYHRASTQASSSYQQKAASAFESADVPYQPFTIQPFRDEINRVIATYIVEGAPRELNLSSRERATVLRGLGYTTHPSAFRTIATTVECALRQQAHPNFIRWTICNGNRPRVLFARGLGVTTIALGFLTAILLTLSSAGRGWRALAALGWFIGVATLAAAWKGMCVVLHGLHHRHLRPWELFTDENDNDSTRSPSMDYYTLSKESFDSGPSSKISYENEPWVARYEKRNLIRKVFDREVWIQEPALRQIQDTIFLQALGIATLASGVLVGLFVALPKGGHF